jgi:predicted N-acetyltransferase YhbS
MDLRDAPSVVPLIVQLGYERSVDEVERWISALAPESCAAFVACLSGEVVGWVEVSLVCHLQSAPHALIGGLVVRDGVRGLGIGCLLCSRAEAWAWERGVEAVRVTSRSTRGDAHRFYLRDGYETVKTSVVFEKKRSA